MGRRGHSTTIGKFAKAHLDRRRSEIRMLGEALRRVRGQSPETPRAVNGATAPSTR